MFKGMKRGNLQMRIRELALLSALALAVAACDTVPTTTDDSTMQAGQGLDSSGFVLGSQEDLAVTAGDRVFFGFDRYDLTAEGQETAARQAGWLQKYPSVTITIAGYCDPRGTEEYNLGLGMSRATALKSALVDLGVDVNRIATISYGKSVLLVEGSTEEAYAQDRAAVITLN